MAYTNRDIVPAAKRGKTASTPNGNFWTVPGFTGNQGMLPSNLYYRFRALNSLGTGHRIEQVIYSYSTPIALKIDGVWIVPDVKYSTTTSSKHATHLWKLPNVRRIPWDATAEDIQRIIAGKMVYNSGRFTAGPNYIAD